jgi:hypothetical protein
MILTSSNSTADIKYRAFYHQRTYVHRIISRYSCNYCFLKQQITGWSLELRLCMNTERWKKICSLFINNQQMYWFLNSLLFYSTAPTCSDTCMSSSGSIPGLHIIDTLQRITQSFINHCIRFACDSAGTEELPDDDMHVSKHVGAVE